MGIPSYFSHIVKRHRNIIKKYSGFQINNLYLDSNSIIYDCLRNIEYENDHDFENALYVAICEKFLEYIKTLNPDTAVLIAFDGVAPIAKLEQQRNRRYKSWFVKELMEKKWQTDPTWDATAITPGTKFMDNIGIYVNNYFSNTEIRKSNNLQELNIIVSSPNEAGEGEHKIFQYIRDQHQYHSETTTAIYGLDADLIMLTLNHLHISKNLFLFRETPHFITSIDKTLSPNENYLMDINELSEVISEDLTKNNTSISDYIFLCFFLGNDFMPHFPALNIRTSGIDILMKAYKETLGNSNQFLTNGADICWKNVWKLVKYLADNEYDYLLDEYKKRDRKKPPPIYSEKGTKEEFEEKLQQLPMKDRNIEKYINPRENGWDKRYYGQLFEMDIDEERKRDICINYLEGLEWTFKYYTEGCIDWRWHYKYDYAPLLKDLIQFIPYVDEEFLTKKAPDPVHKYVQLGYVLPRKSLNLLPPDLYKTLITEHSDLYRLDCEFKWSFCKYFWESHVVMPAIDIDLLERVIAV